MDPNASAELRRWLTEESRFIEGSAAFDMALVEKLRSVGLPIARYTTGVPSLHPQVDSFSAVWEEDKGLSFRTFRRTPEQMETFRGSPIYIVYYEGLTVQTSLEGPAPADEAPILGELREQGFTGYVAIALPFSDGSNKAMTFATRRPGGFTEAEVATLEDIRHLLALNIEILYLRFTAKMLMDTYVGPQAGQRVLDGQIKRGMGETIRAAIWFCDLKGFTVLSEKLSGDSLIEMLNDYFDVMTTAIEGEDGEILKFIGDAVLAIFVPGESGPDGAAARRALAAAHAAEAAMAERNRARGADGKAEIGYGIALHFGDVLYGNVGGQNRLDFTVIGPAVNLASRIEALTRDLDRTLLVSGEFAELHGGAFEALGDFSLKGIDGPRSVFAPTGLVGV